MVSEKPYEEENAGLSALWDDPGEIGAKRRQSVAQVTLPAIFSVPSAEKLQLRVQYGHSVQFQESAAAQPSASGFRHADRLELMSAEREQTHRREENQGGANVHGAAQPNKIICVSPYQKGEQSSQRKIFSRPKTRMLASTAPADRPNVISQGQGAPVLPLSRDARHHLFQLYEEESVGNLSLGGNDITH